MSFCQCHVIFSANVFVANSYFQICFLFSFIFYSFKPFVKIITVYCAYYEGIMEVGATDCEKEHYNVMSQSVTYLSLLSHFNDKWIISYNASLYHECGAQMFFFPF